MNLQTIHRILLTRRLCFSVITSGKSIILMYIESKNCYFLDETLMFKNEPESHDDIYNIGLYYPISRGDSSDNSSCNLTDRILTLKRGGKTGYCQGSEVDYFSYRLESEYLDLNSEVFIVIIPSHDPCKLESGILSIARKLSRNRNFVNAAKCLRRKYKKEKLSSGGDRSLNSQLNSLEVTNPELIKGKNILLLDDVTTTGNSLKAGEILLKKSGANSVVLLALGRTVSC